MPTPAPRPFRFNLVVQGLTLIDIQPAGLTIHIPNEGDRHEYMLGTVTYDPKAKKVNEKDLKPLQKASTHAFEFLTWAGSGGASMAQVRDGLRLVVLDNAQVSIDPAIAPYSVIRMPLPNRVRGYRGVEVNPAVMAEGLTDTHAHSIPNLIDEAIVFSWLGVEAAKLDGAALKPIGQEPILTWNLYAQERVLKSHSQPDGVALNSMLHYRDNPLPKPRLCPTGQRPNEVDPPYETAIGVARHQLLALHEFAGADSAIHIRTVDTHTCYSVGRSG